MEGMELVVKDDHDEPAVPWYVTDDEPNEDPRFFQASDVGKVHVQKGYWLPDIYPDEESKTTAVITGMHYFEALCGLKALYNMATMLGSFPDDRLCSRCRDAVPDPLSNRLFEHD